MKEKIYKKFIVPVILAGGTGSRLWPISRKSFPKQFIEIFNDDNYSLLQKTYKRVEELENISNPIIICNEEHRFITAEQIRKLKIKPNAILLEPFSRNTGPAVAIAALHSLSHGDDPILLILPSDHLIKDQEKFIKSVRNVFILIWIVLAKLRNWRAIKGERKVFAISGEGKISM
mgnify:CR=1 FL=1